MNYENEDRYTFRYVNIDKWFGKKLERTNESFVHKVRYGDLK